MMIFPAKPMRQPSPTGRMGREDLPPAGAPPSSLFQLLVAALLLGPVDAQLPDGNWSAFSSMGLVNDIVPGSGMVWAATDGGVLRYDVSERTYSRFTRVDGLAGSRALTAVADGGGDLWFGTSGEGLSRYVVASGEFAGPFSEFEGLELNDLAKPESSLTVRYGKQ